MSLHARKRQGRQSKRTDDRRGAGSYVTSAGKARTGNVCVFKHVRTCAMLREASRHKALRTSSPCSRPECACLFCWAWTWRHNTPIASICMASFTNATLPRCTSPSTTACPDTGFRSDASDTRSDGCRGVTVDCCSGRVVSRFCCTAGSTGSRAAGPSNSTISPHPQRRAEPRSTDRLHDHRPASGASAHEHCKPFSVALNPSRVVAVAFCRWDGKTQPPVPGPPFPSSPQQKTAADTRPTLTRIAKALRDRVRRMLRTEAASPIELTSGRSMKSSNNRSITWLWCRLPGVTYVGSTGGTQPAGKNHRGHKTKANCTAQAKSCSSAYRASVRRCAPRNRGAVSLKGVGSLALYFAGHPPSTSCSPVTKYLQR